MTSGIEGFKDSTIERPSTPQILKSSNPHKGMTLIELLAVVMIVGIMSSVLIMRLGPMSIGNPGAKAVARRLTLDLRHARSLAIATGVNHYLGFDVSGSSLTGYTIYREAGATDPAVESYRNFERGVTATGSTTRAEFDPTGAALGGYSFVVTGTTQSFTVTVIAATGTTTVSGP